MSFLPLKVPPAPQPSQLYSDDDEDDDSFQNTFPSCLLSKKVTEEHTKNVNDKMLRQMSGPKRGKGTEEL